MSLLGSKDMSTERTWQLASKKAFDKGLRKPLKMSVKILPGIILADVKIEADGLVIDDGMVGQEVGVAEKFFDVIVGEVTSSVVIGCESDAETAQGT